MLNYPAKVKPDGDRWLVTFRDIPEALTDGATEDEALEMAADALLSSMDFYFEDQRAVPLPSKARADERLVELPFSVSAKVLLLNEMLAQQMRPSALAKKMGTTAQEVNRVVDLRHKTKIDTLASAMHALGKRFELRVV